MFILQQNENWLWLLKLDFMFDKRLPQETKQASDRSPSKVRKNNLIFLFGMESGQNPVTNSRWCWTQTAS